MRSKVVYLPIAFSILSMLFLFVAIAMEWMGVSGVAALEYCEELRNRLVRQPANAWSNLGFITVGWVISIQYLKDMSLGHRGTFNQTVFYPVFYSFMAVFLGVGSFAYHASTTHLGGYLDIGSMYLLSTFMLTYALKRLVHLSVLQFAVIYTLGLAVSAYFLFQPTMYPGELDSASMIFGLFLVVACIIELVLIYVRKIVINGKWAMGFIACFLISTFIWARSRTGGVWCDPSSLLQGHAIWHLLDALCVYFIYRYYRSEECNPPPGPLPKGRG